MHPATPHFDAKALRDRSWSVFGLAATWLVCHGGLSVAISKGFS